MSVQPRMRDTALLLRYLEALHTAFSKPCISFTMAWKFGIAYRSHFMSHKDCWEWPPVVGQPMPTKSLRLNGSCWIPCGVLRRPHHFTEVLISVHFFWFSFQLFSNQNYRNRCMSSTNWSTELSKIRLLSTQRRTFVFSFGRRRIMKKTYR